MRICWCSSPHERRISRAAAGHPRCETGERGRLHDADAGAPICERICELNSAKPMRSSRIACHRLDGQPPLNCIFEMCGPRYNTEPQAHNPAVAGWNPAPATRRTAPEIPPGPFSCLVYPAGPKRTRPASRCAALDLHWSGRYESHCETTKFSPCPTVRKWTLGMSVRGSCCEYCRRCDVNCKQGSGVRISGSHYSASSCSRRSSLWSRSTDRRLLQVCEIPRSAVRLARGVSVQRSVEKISPASRTA
jgi:hypothetical protein